MREQPRLVVEGGHGDRLEAGQLRAAVPCLRRLHLHRELLHRDDQLLDETGQLRDFGQLDILFHGRAGLLGLRELHAALHEYK